MSKNKNINTNVENEAVVEQVKVKEEKTAVSKIRHS